LGCRGAFDPSTSSYLGVVGGGLGSISSASTTDLNSAPQANVTITGTTTITSFGSASPTGIEKTIRFDNALKLTNSAALTVPGGFDLTTAANDRAKVTHLGSGNWEITQYTRASGIPIDVSAIGKPSFSFQEGTPSLHVPGDGRALTRTSYPAYFAKVTRAQNGTRTSGNATITGVADTSKLGVGMPVESTGVSAGCTIASVVANTSITLNSSACVTASGTSTVTVFLTGYGSGGGSTTVGVPNCGGATLAGRETTATRLTSSANGFGANSTVMAVFSGAESQTLTINQMAAHTHTGTTGTESATHRHAGVITGGGTTPVNGTGSNASPYTSLTSGNSDVQNANHTHDFTSNSTGSGLPHPIMGPTLIADCNVRVIP
jgi:hypothetical protein